MEITTKLLQDRIQFYREENARLEVLFCGLKIDPKSHSIWRSPSLRTSPTEAFNSNEQLSYLLNPNDLLLSQTENFRNHSKFKAQLKTSIKNYINLNEQLTQKIAMQTRCLQNAKSQLEALKVNEELIKEFEKNAEKYEASLTKLEKKNVWLTDPMYDEHIQEDINILRKLKETKNQLMTDLNKYHDLKPDLKEASQQLSELYLEFKNYN